MKASQLGVEEAPGAAAEEEPAAPADAQSAWRSATRSACTRGRRRCSSGSRATTTPRCASPRPAAAPGARDEPHQCRRARRALRRHAGGQRVGAAGGRGAGALRALADEGFGDGIAAARRAAPTPGGRCPRAGRPAAEVAAPPRRATCSRAWRPRPASRSGPARHLGGPTGPPRRPRAPTRPSASASASTRPSRPPREAIGGDREAVAARAGDAEAAIFDAHLALLDDEALLDPARAAIAAGAAARTRVARRRRAGRRALPRARRPAPARARGGRPGRRAPRRRRGHRRAARRPRRAGHRPRRRAHPGRRGGPGPHARARDRHRPRLGHRARRDPLPRARACRRPSAWATPCSRSPRARRCCSTATRGRCWSTRRPTSWPPRGAPRARRRRRAAALERAGEPGAMRDGTRVEVFANLGSPPRRRRPSSWGPRGSGLLRTEFLFLDRAQLPDEDEQPRRCARSPERSTAGRWSCARSTPAPTSRCRRCRAAEANPFLGVRGSGLALQRPEICSPRSCARSCRGGRAPGPGDVPDGRHARRGRGARALLDEERAPAIDAPLDARDHGRGPRRRATAARLAPTSTSSPSAPTT